jgi:predicted RNA-binding protein
MARPKNPEKPKVVQNPLSLYDPQGVEVEGGGLLSGGDVAFAPDSYKRAFERVFEPRKQKQELMVHEHLLNEAKQELKAQAAKIASLEVAIAKEARIKQSSHAAQLGKIVHEIKRRNHDRASDAKFIASKVDALLKEKGIQLHKVCPKGWNTYRPSGRLIDLLDSKTYPKLHKLVKSYISKA